MYIYDPYCAYIMSNFARTVFYTGFTGCLEGRVWQHKNGTGSKFTAKYKCHYLVYWENYDRPRFAIYRESQLKNWKRQWKIELIRKENPDLLDLAADWYESNPPKP
jgi:putative endonuclease